MRTFTLMHTYDVAPAELLAAMLDPALNAFLAGRVPDLQSRTELDRREERGLIIRRVHCVPVPKIPEVARSIVKPEMIEWIEEARVDVPRGLVTVHITPSGFKNVFSFKGTIRVDALPQGGCVRRADAELGIKMLVVGKYVEDYLIEEIRRNMDAEGNALREFLLQRGGGQKHSASA